MNFDDRFNAAFPYMLPRGISLNSAPIGGPIPLPMPRPMGAEVPTSIYSSPGGPATDPMAAPFRLDKGAVPPIDTPIAAALPAPAMVAPTRPTFPVSAAPAVPYTKPVVQADNAGVTLNSTPAQGWEGSVGVEGPSKIADALKGPNYDKLMTGVEDIAKGLRQKPGDAAANQIIPSNMQPNTGASSAAELMNTLLGAKRRVRGISITG